jgi:hypothetical protein
VIFSAGGLFVRELPVPEGYFEFNGSEVVNYRRYYDDHGNFIEEIWTKNGRHYYSACKPEDMDPEELKNLISAELS